MPPAKRAPKSSTASKPTASKSAAKKPAAKKTTPAAKATATTAGRGAGSTARAATTGAKSTASTAKGGAKQTTTRAKGASARAKETVPLSRGHLQDALDDAASRGRITRKDANDLVSELMRRGKSTGDDVRDEVGELLGKGRTRLETASKRVRKAEPVDRLVRGADRARRAAGVGPTFPILGYDELTAAQVQGRLDGLSPAELRKVRDYERRNANRKSVLGAIEKQLG